MPCRFGISSRKAVFLRLAGGVVTGGALTASIAAATPAGTTKTAPLERMAANLALATPAGAVAAAAGSTSPRASDPSPRTTAPALPVPERVVPRKSAPALPIPRQVAPKQVAPERPDARRPVPKQPPAKRVASAQDVINLAKKQVGIQANAYGGGTKFHRWYMTTDQARLTLKRDGGSLSGYGNAAWCDMFVSWIGHQVGVKGMGQDAYTVAHAKWFQKAGRWGTTPKPGAVVFFAWNGGGTEGIAHVGLVVKSNGDGTIQTIEGNTSNAVKIRQRSVSSVAGYGYPQYAR